MGRNVEEKAEELLAQTGIDSVPVDLERIAGHLGIKIRLKVFEGDLSGVLMRPKAGDPVIAINRSHNKKRQRFSLAHEIAHFQLGHAGELFVDQMVLNRRDVRSSYAIDPQEIEANAFAAALLMPRQFVFDAMVAMFEDGYVQEQTEIIGKLARAFEVSTQAMGYRLINLGLLTSVGDS
jgi:Zn-dependent peptidase ImmA (M78 family)